jgi:hypothetical protein
MLAPAVAADLSIAPIYKAPPAPPVATWSGSYLGVSGGGAWGNVVVRNDLTGADQTPRMDLSGGIIGLTSGFNIQRGPVVFGLLRPTILLPAPWGARTPTTHGGSIFGSAKPATV